MKKFISGICLMAMLCTIAAVLSGCGGDDQMQVMNVSLNPEVEFILDENDKVVSANALNEEGNLIINGQAFVGKNADEALELFISVSKETGFLVEGNYGDNQISISLSGDDANKMYDKLKKDLSDNNSAKYVFKGLGCFSAPPQIITDDDYKEKTLSLFESDIRIQHF